MSLRVTISRAVLQNGGSGKRDDRDTVVATVADMVANPGEATLRYNLMVRRTIRKCPSLQGDGWISPIDNLGMCQVFVHRIFVTAPNEKSSDSAGSRRKPSRRPGRKAPAPSTRKLRRGTTAVGLGDLGCEFVITTLWLLSAKRFPDQPATWRAQCIKALILDGNL